MLATPIWLYKGYRHYGKAGFERSKATFNKNDTDVNLSEKHIVITGASSGIGKEAAFELAKKGGNIHMVCRNQGKGEEVRQQIVQTTGNENIFLHVVDMSVMSDIKEFSRKWKEENTPIHCLINNAGVMIDKRSETKEGLELTYATNLLGGFYLTQLLLPNLHRTALACNTPSSVITVSSGGMYTQKLNVKNLQSVTGKYDGTVAYAQTKRAQVYLNIIYHYLYSKPLSVNFFCMHPGWSTTPGVETSMPGFYNNMQSMMRTAAEGADTIVWLACLNPSDRSGKFFLDRRVEPIHLPLSTTNSSLLELSELWKTLCVDSKWNIDELEIPDDKSLMESIDHSIIKTVPSAIL